MTKPIKIFREGTAQVWRRDGLIHREDGPAMIWDDGMQAWYRNDLLHREDGPAVIYPGGTCTWWFNGRCHPFSEWFKLIDCDDKTKTMLVLKWGGHE
jgi:hypothetical protein